MTKRGEKSLQMIFGLFLLLIISLVVLNMFFKFVGRGSSVIGQESEEYAMKAAKEAALTECENLCNMAGKEEGTIEFCSRVYQVDWNKDGTPQGAAQHGAWWFCEKKIPCFVLVPNCKGTYDGHYCRDLLAQKAPNKYHQLFIEISGEKPQSTTDYDDACLLPDRETYDETAGLFPTDYNWKERFCFSESLATVRDSNFICCVGFTQEKCIAASAYCEWKNDPLGQPYCARKDVAIP
ncbi:hypothetical protein JW930_02790 [Candidatus Woesearchaeota archaeon]|nr:hypothetical protein [Candidatus Woesearchaeota archaeon]